MFADIRFRSTRFEEGYDMEEVDAFIDRVERAVRERDGSLTAQDAIQQRFTVRRFSAGYAMDEVDSFVDTKVVPLLQQGAAGSSPQQPAGETAQPVSADDTRGIHPPRPRPGLLRRLLGGGGR